MAELVEAYATSPTLDMFPAFPVPASACVVIVSFEAKDSARALENYAWYMWLVPLNWLIIGYFVRKRLRFGDK